MIENKLPHELQVLLECDESRSLSITRAERQAIRAHIAAVEGERDRETELRREAEAKLKWDDEVRADLHRGYDEKTKELNKIADMPGVLKSFELGSKTVAEAVSAMVDRWYGKGRKEGVESFRTHLVAAVRNLDTREDINSYAKGLYALRNEPSAVSGYESGTDGAKRDIINLIETFPVEGEL